VAEPISYRVRRVKRSRRVKVRVDPQHGVEVLLPARAPLAAAGEAVAELAPWIERELLRLAGLRERHAPAGTLPYLDERLRVVAQAGRTRAHRQGDALLVPAAVDAAPRAIELWYRRAARGEISRRLDAATAEAGMPYASLTIRNQRTRWASCASGGAMSFNWRLMLGPGDVLDYVVWHEVCHLRHGDHSPAFWGLLERHHPQWRPAAAWLRENGPALVL
jgi:predicted metal-dependent hydrolase